MSYGPNFLIGGTASASAGGGTPAFGFDGNFGTEWEQGGGYPHYLQYDLGVGVAKTPVRLTLRGGLWGPQENPKTFTLLASNTGAFAGEETTLLTVSDAGWSAAYQLKAWTFTNTSAFRYFRMYATAAQGSGNSWCEVVEMDMFEADGYGVNICTGGTALASSNMGSGYEEARAFDGDEGTQWYSANAVSWWIQYDLGAGNSKVVAKLALMAFTNHDGFPKDFTLKASDTGSFGGEEVTLLTVTGAAITQDHQAIHWPVTNSTAYRYYRVVISAVQSGGYAQLAEVTMHESLTPPPTSLVIQDLTLAPSLDNVVLTDKGVLTIQDLTLAPSIDNLVLTAAQGGGSGNMFLVF